MPVRATKQLRNRCVLAIALIHLLLVCIGAFQIPIWELGRVGDWLYTYGRYSGSGSRYSFFAPDVGYGYRTEFDIFDRNAKLIKVEGIYEASTREGNIRVGNLIQVMSNNLNDPEKRQEISGSLVGKVFARHPDAARVTLRLDSMDVPTMKEYREGVRYSAEPIYSAQFSYKKRFQ